jgi:selenocysteine lyase/cysteine desulfurase
VIQDIASIVKAIRERGKGARVMIDAAQTAGAAAIDFREIDLDFLAFTGHKGLMGPQGIGGLVIRKGIDIEPLCFGGTGSDSEFERQPEFLPDRLESGTQNNPGIIGLAAGIRFIEMKGLATIIEKERELTARLVSGLDSINGCRVYRGEPDNRLGVVAYNIDSIPCSSIGQRLNEDHEIFIRTGLHCAPLAHKTLGTFPDGSARVSVSYFNSEDEIDKFIDAMATVRRQ